MPKSERNDINSSLKQRGSLHLQRSGCCLATALFSWQGRTQGTRFWSGCREKKNHQNSVLLRRLPPTQTAFDAVLMLLSFHCEKVKICTRVNKECGKQILKSQIAYWDDFIFSLQGDEFIVKTNDAARTTLHARYFIKYAKGINVFL